MDHLGYLAGAYAIFFAAIFLYVLFLWRRQAALEAELRALEARLRALHSAQSRAPSRADAGGG
jgi:CcmD family protein